MSILGIIKFIIMDFLVNKLKGNEENIMAKLCYKRLFKKLIDIDMKQKELIEKSQISKGTFYKLKNGDNITTDVLLRICNTLNCDISEIVECIDDEVGGTTRV